MEEFNLDFLPAGLDFLPKKFGFPSGAIWIAFNAPAAELDAADI
jgi:hypothetical protein